jgi:hypothetical protein
MISPSYNHGAFFARVKVKLGLQLQPDGTTFTAEDKYDARRTRHE